MIFKSLTGALLSFLLLQTVLFAQDKAQDHSSEKSKVRFGKVSPADFDLSAYKYDSGASAVVIADIGESHIEGNTKGWFSIFFTRIRRVKILDKNGYDAAKEEIRLYSEGTQTEKVSDLKAATYNLENGKVVESKLDDKSVFTEKADKNWIHKKFSLPAVKEGSIIEYSYTIQSDFLHNFQPWAFQGEYPCLWSEYVVAIPEYFHYVQISQGFQPLYIRKITDLTFSAKVIVPGGAGRDETVPLDGRAQEYRMVMKDVPPLKGESYTTTLSNYIAKIEFQLSSYGFPQQPSHDIMGNWALLSQKLMESEYFGAAITKNNGWMDDEVKVIIKGAIGEMDKARKIYAYVRDNFNCTSHGGSIETETPLKTIFKSKSGTAAQINLLLTAMLNHVNLSADPVILGTRDQGYTNPVYPLITRFNYVICQVKIDQAPYYLDASQSWNGFGHLPGYCYNGHARLINKETPGAVFFFADSLKERKTTLVVISNDEKGGISGAFQSTLGVIGSSEVREEVRKRGEKDYFKDIQTSCSPEIVIANTGIDSLKIPDEPVKLAYEFTFKPAAEDGLIYFNPMLGDGYKTNPFKSAERKYPVEMPYQKDEMYLLNMEVPSGYTVDEIPKSAKVLFNDTEGYFEYLVVSDGQNIQLRSHLKLNKADFQPDDYETLRDFFAFVVKKQGEQIVFKKKK